MEKKLERLFRDRRLTPDEIASDAQVREKVENEFPPCHSAREGSPSQASHPAMLSELLKRSIRESNKSVDEIAGDAGVSPVLVARFMSGERDIHIATADKLAEAVGLNLAAQ
jgi:hypothetical protein